MHATTFEGLHKWSNHAYKHLGYMVLAQHEGNKSQIKVYVESISRLEKAIISKITSTYDADRVQDLEILLEHARVLKTVAKALFN